MTSGFNPMSMFKPTANLVVQQKMKNLQTLIPDLLIEQSFLTEFRKPNNELLEKYMTYSKYKQLVQYTTIIGDGEDKNRSFKFPFLSAQILSIDNQNTYKFFVSDKPIVEDLTTYQQIQIQKENQSDQSFVSNRSSQSIVSDQSQAESQKHNQILEQVNLQNLPSLSIQKNASQINQDDFPLVQQIKKIKVKQKIKVTKKMERKPLIEDLFLYFQQPINHTLSGYVCKIINALLSKKKQNLKYFIKNRIQTLIKHVQSRSVEDLIIRICTIENQLHIQDQIGIMQYLIEQFMASSQIQLIQNIGYLVSEIVKKVNQQYKNSSTIKKMLTQILKSQILRTLINTYGQYLQTQKQIIESETQMAEFQYFTLLEIKSKQVLKIIEQLIQMILIACTLQSESFLNFQDQLNHLVESLCNKLALFSKEKMQVKGTASIKISVVFILFKIISQNIAFSQQIISDRPQFYGGLFKLVKKYPNNNILHNEIFKLIQYVISSIQSINKAKTIFVSGTLVKNIFELKSQDCLLHFMCETFINSKSQNLNYLGHIYKLALLIDSIETKYSDFLKDFKQTKQWQKITLQFLNPYKDLMKINLGSYSKRREICASISFQKKQILDKYEHFLNGAKFMELDMFDNFQPTDSDSSHDQNQIKQRKRQIQEMQKEECQLNIKLSQQEEKQDLREQDNIQN